MKDNVFYDDVALSLRLRLYDLATFVLSHTDVRCDRPLSMCSQEIFPMVGRSDGGAIWTTASDGLKRTPL